MWKLLFVASFLLVQHGKAWAEQKPRITRFEPTTAAVGSAIEIHGGPFQDTDEIKLGELTCNRSVPYSDEKKLTVFVPEKAETDIFIIVRDGSAVAQSKKSLQVVPKPEIDGYAPRDGEAGTEVTITGNGFRDYTVAKMEFVPRSKGLTYPTTWKKIPIVKRSETNLVVKLPKNSQDGRFMACNFTECGATRHSFDVHQPIRIRRIAPLRGAPGSEIVVTFPGRAQGLGRFFLEDKPLTVVKRRNRGRLTTVWFLYLKIPEGAVSGRIMVETYGKIKPTKYKFKVERKK